MCAAFGDREIDYVEAHQFASAHRTRIAKNDQRPVTHAEEPIGRASTISQTIGGLDRAQALPSL